MKKLPADIIHLVHSGNIPAISMPQGFEFIALPRLTINEWRGFYRAIGAPYLWWEKNLWNDRQLGDYIQNEKTYYTIKKDNQHFGIAEIDNSDHPTIDLAYFGLYKFAHGMGLGLPFLSAVLRVIQAMNPRTITINTCILDHPNALKLYIKGGFVLHHLQPRFINDPRDGKILPADLPLPPHYPHQPY